MTNNLTGSDAPSNTTKRWRIGLWVGQIVLAGVFMAAGLMKVATPADQLMAAMKDAGLSLGMARFIGAVEVAGAVGLILPALTRIYPILTPIAASGLVIVMVLAAGFNAMHGELGALVTTLVLGFVALLVAWGRFKEVPIAARYGR